jgi:predicted deacylase
VSVSVLRGAKPGKRVTLVSGVHGDEMSSMHAVQTIVDGLDPAAMSGTVMAVFDVSRPAIESMGRRWPNSGRGADLIDLNRVWPGDENGPGAPARHAGLLFNRLIRPNSDYVLDFHTGFTGIDAPAFHLARTCRKSGPWRNSSQSIRSLTMPGIPVFLRTPSIRWVFRHSRPRSVMAGASICR